jgi:RHS repeat-associated protein
MDDTATIFTIGGSGPNPPAGNTSFLESARGVIRTDVVLDGNGRVAELIDDRGAGTAFGYDTLDRQVTLAFHDGSVRTNTFNPASDIVAYVDENGSAFAFTLDAIGRRTAVAITPAALTSLYGTTAQSFQYDGLSRVTFSQDSASTTSIVQPYYDSLGQVLEENQNIGSVSHYVTHNAWTSYPATGFTFPSSRELIIGFDALNRKNTINETSGGASIAAWQFFGNRVGTVTLGNGIICSFMNNAQSRSAVQAGLPTPPWGSATTDQLGYDGSGRVITKRYLLPTSGGGSPGPATLVVGFTTAYDRSSNKLFERHLHAESRSHLYPAYDSPDRLLQYQRGVLATGGASITTAITLPNTDGQRSYALDGLGNWNNTAFTPVGGSPTTEYRRHNYLNQITRYGTTPVLYDHGNNAASLDPNVEARGNGNIADDGLRTYQYDALNRLSQVFRKSDGLVIANYYYDALGRRTIKFVSNGGIPNDPALNAIWTYLYDGARIVEELNGTTAAQYVWGQYIDELIQLNAVMALGPQGLTGKYYLLSDLLYRSVALTNSTGGVVEAYDTDAYGNTLLFKAAGMPGWFNNDDVQADYSACRYVFTGREYDAETDVYFYRARYYQPSLGRLLSRDPLGYRGGINQYGYARSAPVAFSDPTGLTIVIKNPAPPVGGRQKWWEYVMQALAAMCPCVTLDPGDVTTDASNVTVKSVMDKKAFCDCYQIHPGGCKLLYDLLRSTTAVNLTLGSANQDSAFPPTSKDPDIEVLWNPSPSGLPKDVYNSDIKAEYAYGGLLSHTFLGHELFHAWDYQYTFDIASRTDGINYAYEDRAVRFENQLYLEMRTTKKGETVRLRDRYSKEHTVPDFNKGIFVPNAPKDAEKPCNCDDAYDGWQLLTPRVWKRPRRVAPSSEGEPLHWTRWRGRAAASAHVRGRCAVPAPSSGRLPPERVLTHGYNAEEILMQLQRSGLRLAITVGLLAALPSCASSRGMAGAGSEEAWADPREQMRRSIPDPVEMRPLVDAAWGCIQGAGLDRLAQRQLSKCDWRIVYVAFGVRAGYTPLDHRFERKSSLGPGDRTVTDVTVAYIGASDSFLGVASNHPVVNDGPVSRSALFDYVEAESAYYLEVPLPLNRRAAVEDLVRELWSGNSAVDESPSLDGTIVYFVATIHGGRSRCFVDINTLPAATRAIGLAAKFRAVGRLYEEAWSVARGPAPRPEQ